MTEGGRGAREEESPSFPGAANPCIACGARLWSEARFCHRCGAAVGTLEEGPEAPPEAGPPLAPRPSSFRPELLLGLLAVGALVALVVGQRLGIGRPSAADRARADSAIAADSAGR